MKNKIKNGVVLGVFVMMFILTFWVSGYKIVEAKEGVIDLSYSSHFPAEHGIAKATLAWAQEIEKRTSGRVKITIHYSGTLTSAPACYEGVVRGISDIGETVLALNRGRFPLMEAIDLPGYPSSAIITSRVAHDFYKKFKPKELADTHVLYVHAHIPGGIFTRNKPVRTLEDLKGLRIRCTGLSAKIIKALGGTPVAMAKGEQYDAMHRGIVDGTTGAPNEFIYFKVADVAQYITMHSPVGYVTAFCASINQEKWNSLPPDIQKIFTEVSEGWPEYLGKVFNDMEIKGFEYGQKLGRTIISLSSQEGARWEKAIAPLYDEYLKAMEAKGLPGKEALQYRQQLIDKYSKMYPQLKFD